jgi:N-acetylated-alpha-linked acidic dipeptidase
MESLYQPAKAALEEKLLGELSLDVPWALIERFTTLVRESGSEDERIAAQYISERLSDLGVPHQVHRPELFLSVPVSASLEVDGQPLRAKAPSCASTTGPAGVTGEVVYLKRRASKSVGDFFDFSAEGATDVAGKIVLLEGMSVPKAVWELKQRGAMGQVYINPGVDIHWGTCTTVWGAPDLDSDPRQPKTPVVNINRPDGDALIKQLQEGRVTATIRTEMREGWFECPVIVADIKGQVEPERFMLVHGHLDSWDVGIGDNAVGNATLLELARVFHRQRDHLARSLKIAWWTGHSTGRYAGSTWFADTFGLELARNCIAQVNIDSPGCRWATEYYDISWMTEAEDFCIKAIKDVTGQEAVGERPHQAGDYSFNNIGISGFFMLLSTMPKELLKEKGYYPVGGCGANIAWHTENDTLEIADRDNLGRDLQVYVATLQRVLNNPIHPFDFRKLAAEFRSTLDRYSEGAKDKVDFSAAYQALVTLQSELNKLYEKISSLQDKPVGNAEVRRVNEAILELGRILIPINYTRQGRFRNEPAVSIPPLPDIASAQELKEAEGHRQQVLRTHTVRGLNRVAWAFEQAAEAIRRATS